MKARIQNLVERRDKLADIKRNWSGLTSAATRAIAPALLALATLDPQLSRLRAQGTAFTYQGRLNDGGVPANGNYDLRFGIYDSPGGGLLVGGLLTNAPTGVSNGLFTATLDFGSGVFSGPARWLEIGVRTNGSTNAYQILAPRQPLTAAPYAVTAGNVTGVLPAGALSGTYPGAVTFNNGTNVFAGNGAGLTSLNASQLTSGTVPTAALGKAWQTAGNSGTTPGTNFLGTTDSQPLELWVNQSRALRLEPNTNGAPNVIGGAPNNFVDTGIFGATIAGGGVLNYSGFLSGPGPNHVAGNFGAIGGGRLNTVSADHSTISGGLTNTIEALAYESAIGGGGNNLIGSGAQNAVIAGGYFNTVVDGSSTATVSGGRQNLADGDYATVGGGFQNSASNLLATVSGGHQNLADGNYATVSGGDNNHAAGAYSAVSGGAGNSATNFQSTAGGGGSNLSGGNDSTVPGGFGNYALGDYSFAAGNQAQAIHNGAFVWADAQSVPFASTTSNQFLIRAQGGVGINTNTPAGAALNVAGTVRAASFQGDGSGLFNVGGGGLSNYVYAFNNAVQSVGTGNVFQDVMFATDAQLNGWMHTAGASQYTNAQTGLYLIEFDANVTTTSGNGTNVQLRATLNGIEIPGSRSIATFSAVNQFVPLSRSLLTSANSGDVLTIQFTGSGTGIRLGGTAGSALTITRIQ